MLNSRPGILTRRASALTPPMSTSSSRRSRRAAAAPPRASYGGGGGDWPPLPPPPPPEKSNAPVLYEEPPPPPPPPPPLPRFVADMVRFGMGREMHSSPQKRKGKKARVGQLFSIAALAFVFFCRPRTFFVLTRPSFLPLTQTTTETAHLAPQRRRSLPPLRGGPPGLLQRLQGQQ